MVSPGLIWLSRKFSFSFKKLQIYYLPSPMYFYYLCPQSKNLITSYFAPHGPPPAKKVCNEPTALCPASNNPEQMECSPSTSSSLPLASKEINRAEETVPKSSTPSSKFSNDIGDYVGKEISDYVKKNLLENPWTPHDNYEFPFSSRMVNGKPKRNYVSRKHLEDHKEWLILSDTQKGLFCKFCPLFVNRLEAGYQKNVSLGSLVKVPLKNFKKLTGKNSELEVHSCTRYHKDAVSAGKEFLKNYYKPESNVINRQDRSHLQQVQENRKKLLSIVKTVVLLGRQNVPFRGHRDDGSLFKAQSELKNEGNFREFLRFRIDSGDKILESHIQDSSVRSTYTSKTTQNEVIDCCRCEILEKILSRVTAARYYSIMFDECADLSGVSQISLILRYVDLLSEKLTIREDFVAFIDAFGELQNILNKERAENEDEDVNSDDESEVETEGNNEDAVELSLTGVSVAEIVLQKMEELNLKFENCVGIGTDGCSVMLGEKAGAVKEIQKHAKNALMTPCFSHKLNNTLSKSSDVLLIKKASCTIKEATRFFKSKFPKRHTALKKVLGRNLVQLCETRWIKRHDSVLQFTSDLPKIVEAMDRVSKWKDRNTAGQATVLLAALCNSDFLIGLYCLSDILSLTHSLSELLQKKALDLVKASEVIATLMTLLEERRENAEEIFRYIFKSATEMGLKIDVEIKKPRTCRRQTLRDNPEIENCEAFYRITGYIPLLDSVIADLKIRFSEDVLSVFKLCSLFPQNIVKLESHNEIAELTTCLLKTFGNQLDVSLGPGLQKLKLKAELEHWQQKFKLLPKSKFPDSAENILSDCDRDIYPIIHQLLRILATLPVSNASAERSFSSLRRIKTWLRTTMTETRLVGLALLHIHHDIPVNPEDIVERFAKRGNRRMVLS